MPVSAQELLDARKITDKIDEHDSDHVAIMVAAHCLNWLADAGHPAWKQLYHSIKTEDAYSENFDEVMEQFRTLLNEYDVEGSN